MPWSNASFAQYGLDCQIDKTGPDLGITSSSFNHNRLGFLNNVFLPVMLLPLANNPKGFIIFGHLLLQTIRTETSSFMQTIQRYKALYDERVRYQKKLIQANQEYDELLEKEAHEIREMKKALGFALDAFYSTVHQQETAMCESQSRFFCNEIHRKRVAAFSGEEFRRSLDEFSELMGSYPDVVETCNYEEIREAIELRSLHHNSVMNKCSLLIEAIHTGSQGCVLSARASQDYQSLVTNQR